MDDGDVKEQFFPSPTCFKDFLDEMRRTQECCELLRADIGALRRGKLGAQPELRDDVRPASPTASDLEPTTTLVYIWSKDLLANVWHISVPPNPEQVLHFAHHVGFAYIQVLLKSAPTQLAPSQVQALVAGPDVTASPLSYDVLSPTVGREQQAGNLHFNYETNDPAADTRTKRDVGKRLCELDEQIAKAESTNDLDQLKRERKQLRNYLQSSTGIGGRSRHIPTPERKALDAVRKGIARTLNTIEKVDCRAAEFLREHIIRKGWRFSYDGTELEWRFSSKARAAPQPAGPQQSRPGPKKSRPSE